MLGTHDKRFVTNPDCSSYIVSNRVRKILISVNIHTDRNKTKTLDCSEISK